MPSYLRPHAPGGSFFITMVTHLRRPLFNDAMARQCLRESIELAQHADPFRLLDIVLLPDHVHLLFELHEHDADFSARVSRIKTGFTRRWLSQGGTDLPQSASRESHAYRGIWQKRFWEHTIRDDTDLARCRDYLYFNPVKHGLCRWPWSSFQRAVVAGKMPPEWCCVCHGAAVKPPVEIRGAEMD
jgi:putative transposase